MACRWRRPKQFSRMALAANGIRKWSRRSSERCRTFSKSGARIGLACNQPASPPMRNKGCAYSTGQAVRTSEPMTIVEHGFKIQNNFESSGTHRRYYYGTMDGVHTTEGILTLCAGSHLCPLKSSMPSWELLIC